MSRPSDSAGDAHGLGVGQTGDTASLFQVVAIVDRLVLVLVQVAHRLEQQFRVAHVRVERQLNHHLVVRSRSRQRRQEAHEATPLFQRRRRHTQLVQIAAASEATVRAGGDDRHALGISARLDLLAGDAVDLGSPLVLWAVHAQAVRAALRLRRVGARADTIVARTVGRLGFLVRVPLFLVVGLGDGVTDAHGDHVDLEGGDDHGFLATHDQAEARLLQADLVDATAAGAGSSASVHALDLLAAHGALKIRRYLGVLEWKNVRHRVMAPVVHGYLRRTDRVRSKAALTPGGQAPLFSSMNALRASVLMRDCNSSTCPVWRM